MAKNTNPIFELEPRLDVATLTAANTAKDGSGTITTLVTGHAEGTRIDLITFISAQASVTTNSAMMCRVYVSNDNGSTWTFWDEVALGATAGSNSAPGAKGQIPFPQGLKLKNANYKIGITKSVHAGAQDEVDAIAEGGDFAA